MLGDEINPNEAPIELSDEELDEVAGGFSLRFTAARFQQSVFTFAQETSQASGSTQSGFQAETTESSFLQLTIVDATTDDLKVLSELFGGASAIEGST
jgi:hypothetical protein